MSLKYYGEKQSNCSDSTCCYFDGYGLYVDKSEVERLVDAVKNKPQDFLPEYLPKIKEIIDSRKFIKEENNETIILNRDKSKPLIEFCMTKYYPCFFLVKDNKDTACMIYPYKFNRCKNTKCEECYKSSK